MSTTLADQSPNNPRPTVLEFIQKLQRQTRANAGLWQRAFADMEARADAYGALIERLNSGVESAHVILGQAMQVHEAGQAQSEQLCRDMAAVVEQADGEITIELPDDGQEPAPGPAGNAS